MISLKPASVRRACSRCAQRQVQARARATRRAAHHHADVGFQLLVDRSVKHEVHELVKTTERAGDMAVGVQLDCVGASDDRAQIASRALAYRVSPAVCCAGAPNVRTS